jgi:hypothetical protein
MAQAKKEAAAKAKADNLPKTKPDPKPAKWTNISKNSWKRIFTFS